MKGRRKKRWEKRRKGGKGVRISRGKKQKGKKRIGSEKGRKE